MRFPFSFQLSTFSFLLLASCASHAPKISHAPAPQVSTAALRSSIAKTAQATNSANTRLERVIQTVDRIKVVPDPAQQSALLELKKELFSLQIDLREAKAAIEESEGLRALADADAFALRAWGIAQQTAADSNATGWQKAEAQVREKQVTLDARNLTIAKLWSALIAGLVLIAGFFIARQYFPFLKFL